MKKKIRLIIWGMLIATCLMGCSGEKGVSEEEMVSTDAFTGKYLVTADYAVEHIGDEQVVFVDCRGEKQANKGTVSGAIATTWQEIGTCGEEYGKAGDEGWGKIPEPEDLAERLGKLGIDKEKEIICLGHTLSGWGDDARVAWELIAAGYENVKIVDGGIDAVFDTGAKTQKGGSEPTPCSVTIDAIDKTHVMETEEFMNNYDEYVVVDVRTKEEFDGAVKYKEAQGGHLPGAIHLPYTGFFREDGTLISAADVEKMLEEKGVKKTDKIVTYCTGGIRSAYEQMVFEMAGYENTWNYDQSFWRWAVVGEVEK